MKFLEFLKENIVLLDGGMGTLLQEKGLKSGEKPELWNITHPEIIVSVHKDYFEAGSNVVSTNTFGANLLKFSEQELEKIIKSAVENAKKARDTSKGKKEKFIALDIGPLGKLLKPLGDLEFEKAVEIFSKTVEIGTKYGVDLVILETFNDSYETKAALLAVKENCDLPVIVSNAYSEDKKLMTGADTASMVALLEGMGADVLGANCSLGPKQLKDVAEELLENASIPVSLKPNAGLPRLENGKTVFDVTPEEFAEEVAALVKKGLRVIGGCCGTTPEYIRLLADKTKDIKPVEISYKNKTVVSSYSHAVSFDKTPVLIGERINPTGKKRFKQALIENDIDYILQEGVKQQEKGVHILDVNVGLPEIDEVEMLKNSVTALQSVTDLPLQIDTANVTAMEKALRLYNGKAMINSVNGKKSSMDAVFPLVKKYGGVVVALTLDENGIPEKAEQRVEIAKKILKEAQKYGIDKKDIVFDTLAMSISADNNAANETLKALKIINEELGCKTSLGVSNISFGLPNRDIINSTFFSLALENGLSAAIMNPYSEEMLKTYFAFNALKGNDQNCLEYINYASGITADQKPQEKSNITLKEAIIKGFGEKAANITKELLKENEPLKVINGDIIPALNTVGKAFENKTLYLPQLLMSAESAKSAFEVIKQNTRSTDTKNGKTVVIATVKGDIHDIGKNIVKLLLQNYGFCVIDLGKDVPSEKIVDEAIKNNASLVCLSALMTTTLPAMEETIALLKQKAPCVKTMVGGAVLNEEYANKIGADKYAKDALEAVKYATELK